jgi:hypothetical protein
MHEGRAPPLHAAVQCTLIPPAHCAQKVVSSGNQIWARLSPMPRLARTRGNDLWRTWHHCSKNLLRIESYTAVAREINGGRLAPRTRTKKFRFSQQLFLLNPPLGRLFKVNSEPHTGARPSVPEKNNLYWLCLQAKNQKPVHLQGGFEFSEGASAKWIFDVEIKNWELRFCCTSKRPRSSLVTESHS